MGLFDLVAKEKSGIDGDQTIEERDLANKIRAEVDRIRGTGNRVAHEGIWMTNIAYVVGYDGVVFNTTARQFQPINRASSFIKRNRIHLNKILPTLQNRLARLCKNPPKYDVIPESDSVQDKEAARLAQQVLGCMWNKLHLNEKRIPLYMWTQQTGHAYIKISWDVAGGEMRIDPESNEWDHEGEVRAEICSPFEIFPNPMAKNFEEVLKSWLIQCKVRPLDYFKSHYPEKGNLVKEEQAWLLSVQYENRINGLNARGPGQGSMQDQMKDSAIEIIKYQAPSKEFPKGRMTTTANGILLEDKELPVGCIPFAKFDDVVVAGKYYPEAVTTHLRPLQDYYNEILRRRSAWTRKLLAGKYKAARGSGLQQESMNDDESEIVYYDVVPNAPGGPEAIQVPNIPQFAYSEEDKVVGMFNDVSGISEVSRGNMPSASIPAIGMQLLTEQDDTRIGVMTEQHEHSWALVGGLILKHVEAFWTYKRKLKVAGETLSYTVKEVSGEDLYGNTDVTVIRGSTLPGSKTLKRQEILNTMSLGLLGDPKNPAVAEKILGMIEFGDVQSLWADYGVDMSQIRRGMDLLKQGMPVDPNKKDNNALWIVELNRYRKTEEFEQLPDQIRILIEEQIDTRADLIVAMNTPPPAPPPELMGGAPGGPPPPGGAPAGGMGA